MPSDETLARLGPKLFRELPRYHYIEPLGQGGMGAVYEATDQRFEILDAAHTGRLTLDQLRARLNPPKPAKR